MSGNTFGQVFKLTTFGESHGVGLGGAVDGCPPAVELNEEIIQRDLDRRKPGQGVASTARKESDAVKLLSGVFEGKTTGTPIGFVIYNEDQRSRDYSAVCDIYRPGHADCTYQAKYGLRDYRGGGRSSGRETACRVAGGAVARALLAREGVRVYAFTRELGGIAAEVDDPAGARDRQFGAPNDAVIPVWEERVKQVKGEGDSLGGVVEVRAEGVPAGLGEPVFDKLDARLAYACMSVGAVKAVEMGSGLEAARMRGSEHNDIITPQGFITNHAGGVLGGVSNGDAIILRCAIKPIPSIAREQRTINESGEETEITIGGRHDISAVPRVNPVLEAMVLLTLADMWCLQKRNR